MDPGTTLGKYKLVSFLGRGGFGQVYRAIQGGPAGFSRPVAVKVLRAASQRSQAAIDEFAREARTIARLQHRNIVQVYEFTVEQDQYLLVMELIDGVTLLRLMGPPHGPLPFWLRVAVAQEVCRGLHYAHNLRDENDGRPLAVIHRDIKPSNILVSQQGDVKLTDFGLAKMSMIESDQLTDLGVVKGTPAYMSPEQWCGENATPRSDVFSLAAVLYELCSGVRFTSLSPRGAAGVTRPQPASAYNPLVPPPLDDLLLRCLSSDPQERPSSALLLHTLQQVLGEIAPAGQLSRLSEELAGWVKRARAEPPPAEAEDPVSSSRPPTASASAPAGTPAFAPRVLAAPAARPDRGGLEESTTAGEETQPRQPAAARRQPRRLALGALAAVWLVTVGAATWFSLVDREKPPAAGPRRVATGSEDDARTRRSESALARLALDGAGTPASSNPATAAPDGGLLPSPRALRPRPRPRPQRLQPGQLSLNSEPWAEVYLDGKLLGTTPLFQVRVPAGTHQLRLVAANRRTLLRRVAIPPGGHLRLGRISMTGR